MEFDYSSYLESCCIFPLLVLLVTLSGLLFYSIKLIILIKKKEKPTSVPIIKNDGMSLKKEPPQHSISSCIGGLLMMVYFFAPAAVVPLATGGIHLVYERPEDVVEIVGIVEEIETDKTLFDSRIINTFTLWGSDPLLATRWNGKKQSAHAWFTVNGEVYSSILQGDIAVGDAVSMSCLPRSRYVLSVYKLSGTSGDKGTVNAK